MKLTDLKEGFDHPSVMYHYTASENRARIRRRGLVPGRAGGVYMATKLDPNHGTGDIWEVDVSGLRLDPDHTTDPPDPDDTWWVFWNIVKPARLRLIRQGTS